MSKSESRIDLYRWVKPTMALILFLVAFLPRAIYPVSRPFQWYTRSVMFVDSVARGAWGETVYSEHPGVTTMWLSGVALRSAGVVPERRPDGPYVDPEALTARESAIGVLPLALAIAGLVVLTYFLLVRLFDRPAAFGAALLVALDPFFVANSKVLHVDGLLAATMSTSALALLVFVRDRRLRWVILSGALGGLALLTKSPALFLVPYAALCLGVSVLADRAMDWRRALLAGFIWLVVLGLVYGALFPAMWVAPVDTLKTVYERAALRVSWAHPNPLYFLGRAFVGDPGPTYYLYTWAYKVTPVVAVFGLLALVYAAFGKALPRRGRVTVGLIFAYAFFFTLQMTLGAKKMPRYLLPAFPLVDVLAGVGLAQWAKAKPRVQSPNPKAQNPKPKSPISNLKSQASNVLIGAALLLQAALVLPRHPYYDTYFNELAGGARAGVTAMSTQWQGEGLDVAARRLGELPGAERQTVGSHKGVFFRQYYVGQTVGVDEPADWYVFGINNVQEGGDGAETWVVDLYRRRQAWDTVVFDGIPYVWVYRATTGPQNLAAFAFEPGVQLVGYDLAPSPHHPGETLRLQLYWRALEPLAEDYTVFVHVLSEGGAGQLVTQQDNPPVRGTRPTSTWEPGVVVVDPYDLPIPSDTPLGEYVVAVGLYRWPDLSRLPVRDGEGAPIPDDRVLLTTVHVEQEPSSSMAWIARALAFLLVLSAVLGLGRKRG
jgi:hypothetical protein